MTRKSHSLSAWRTRWHNEMSLCVIMQCNQNLLFYKTLPFLQSLFSTSKSIKIYWGWFHQDIKAFLRVSAGRVMQKGSKSFPGYRRDFSDSSGLHPDYCFILFRGEIVHWAHILTVTSKALLSAEGQQAETALASPELLKIQGEQQVKQNLLWLFTGHRRVVIQVLNSYKDFWVENRLT